MFFDPSCAPLEQSDVKSFLFLGMYFIMPGEQGEARVWRLTVGVCGMTQHQPAQILLGLPDL